MYSSIISNRVKDRRRRVRGLAARRQADAIAARAADYGDDIERDALARLAARSAVLAARSRGERGWAR